MLWEKMKEWIKKIPWNWNIIVTFFVGVASFFNSWRSNSIYELQATIAKNSVLPNFQVNEERVYRDYLDKDYSVLQIANLGGKYHNYNAKVVTFLICDLIDELDRYYFDVYVPLDYYYGQTLPDHEDNNVIQTFTNSYARDIVYELNKNISLYNENSSRKLNVFLNTYIQIEYVNLLGEEEIEYYSLNDLGKILLMDNQEGEYVFNIYDKYILCGNGIEIRRNEEISVQQLIEKVIKIYENNEKELQIEAMEEEDVKTLVLGILLGIVIIGGADILRESVRKKTRVKHFALLLYYDLKNVESYLKEEIGNVNLSYTNEWKKILVECTMLKSDEIAYLYDLYNAIYSYCSVFEQKMINVGLVHKKDIISFDVIRRKIFLENVNYIDTSRYKVEYENIIKKLEKEI